MAVNIDRLIGLIIISVAIHRFDCGSGTGKVRSEEPVLLNQWNTVTIYRHRWDAWLVLNEGNRIQGRSKVSCRRRERGGNDDVGGKN